MCIHPIRNLALRIEYNDLSRKIGRCPERQNLKSDVVIVAGAARYFLLPLRPHRINAAHTSESLARALYYLLTHSRSNVFVRAYFLSLIHLLHICIITEQKHFVCLEYYNAHTQNHILNRCHSSIYNYSIHIVINSVVLNIDEWIK